MGVDTQMFDEDNTAALSLQYYISHVYTRLKYFVALQGISHFLSKFPFYSFSLSPDAVASYRHNNFPSHFISTQGDQIEVFPDGVASYCNRTFIFNFVIT